MSKTFFRLALVSSLALAAPLFALAAGSSAGGGLEVLTPILNRNIPTWQRDPGFDNHPVVELFVNQPVHNSTYDRYDVPLQYRVEYGVCQNLPSRVRVIARYDANGGLQTTFTGDSSVDWRNVHNAVYQEGNCGGPFFCVTSASHSSRVSLTDMLPAANKTTLQIVAKWNNNPLGIPSQPDSNLDPSDQMISLGHAHAFNIWLQLLPLATPTPTPAPTPSPCPTPCTTDIDIGQKANIIAGGNVQSTQNVTVIGQKTDQTITQNITQAMAKEEKEEVTDQSVTFSKSDGRKTARVGEILTYRIVVRNPNDRDLTEVKVVDRVPPFLIPIDTSPAARADAKTRTISWSNQTISAKAEVTFAFRARVAADAPNGFLLQNVADLNGPGIHASATDVTEVIAPQVATAAAAPRPRPVPVTAKTGTPLDTLSLLLSLSGSVATAGTFLVRRFA